MTSLSRSSKCRSSTKVELLKEPEIAKSCSAIFNKIACSSSFNYTALLAMSRGISSSVEVPLLKTVKHGKTHGTIARGPCRHAIFFLYFLHFSPDELSIRKMSDEYGAAYKLKYISKHNCNQRKT